MQAEAFEQRLAVAGRPVARVIVPGEDHMSIVREMGVPGSGMARLLEACLEQSML